VAKRRFRLGMWMRLGIVLTALWIVGATLYRGSERVVRDSESAFFLKNICEQRQALEPEIPRPDCEREFNDAQRIASMGQPFQIAAIEASVWAGLFWITLGIFYLLGRWILAGRMRKIEEEQVPDA